MMEQLESVRKQFLTDIESFPEKPQDIEHLRSKYLGRKGLVASLFGLMGKATAEERPALGKEINILKQDLTVKFDKKENIFSTSQQ
nr:phenylalanine--tRNA ligase subunit alpha [Candidatus Neomarinimicrobiota bacterium]